MEIIAIHVLFCLLISNVFFQTENYNKLVKPRRNSFHWKKN